MPEHLTSPHPCNHPFCVYCACRSCPRRSSSPSWTRSTSAKSRFGHGAAFSMVSTEGDAGIPGYCVHQERGNSLRNTNSEAANTYGCILCRISTLSL